MFICDGRAHALFQRQYSTLQLDKPGRRSILATGRNMDNNKQLSGVGVVGLERI